MHIKRRGKPYKLPYKMCIDAVKFYGKYLLGPRLYEKINLELEFESLKRQPFFGYCECLDEEIRPKDFRIVIHNKLTKVETLVSIAHEMVHLKQYAKDEVRDLARSNHVRFRNEYIDTDKVDYWEFPWEIEAHGREKGLYYKFLEECENNGIR